MNVLFYVAAAVAILATVMVITRLNAVHALLYFIVSLFAAALLFFLLGAPFAAVLEVIVYAGAIMVLFVFAAMLLNLGEDSAAQERQWLRPGIWFGPSALAAILLLELGYMLFRRPGPVPGYRVLEPSEVGVVLLGPYLLGVELASMLLLAGLIGAYHLARRETPAAPEGGEPR
jgi:NADH-quinone oxidoreductase subunit J